MRDYHVQMYTYTFAVLGEPITLKARNVADGRRKVLNAWLQVINMNRLSLPVVPTIVLLESVDPAANDTRLVAPGYLKKSSNVTALF